MASPPSLFHVLRSPWIWGCFVVVLALRCLYFDTFALPPESAELLSWGQQVAQAPYLGLQQLLADVAQPGPLHSAAYPLNKLHQWVALPIEHAYHVTQLSALWILMPGLMLGSHSLWAVQFFSAAWALWVAFLAGLWAVRLLSPAGYQARHERLGILLATLLLVAFNPLVLRYSLYPSSSLVALGFILGALALVGSRPAAAQWYLPQKIAVALQLILALYAAPLWPMAFLLPWMLWDLICHFRQGATWRFWGMLLLAALPALLWLARPTAQIVPEPWLQTFSGGSFWSLLSIGLACSSLGLLGLFYGLSRGLKNPQAAWRSSDSPLPWWLGWVAVLTLAFVFEHSALYLALALGIPLGVAALWPQQIARQYVGTLALCGAFVVSVFPVWIVHHGFPQESRLSQQAASRQHIIQWLQHQPLHNTTLFFSTPHSARLFLPRVVPGSALTQAAGWSQALKSGSTTRFREQYYPKTPILSQKWLVVSETEQAYLQDLRPFFGLKPLHTSGPWRVIELGARP